MKKKGFTLVELLAVIVILAVILVIAVPKIMDTIQNSKEGTLMSSAKLIANQAEKKYVENQVLGINDVISCDDVAKTTDDYDYCNISFDSDGKASVTISGKGKFEGMAVCNGTKTEASISDNCYTDEACFAYSASVSDFDINETACEKFLIDDGSSAEEAAEVCASKVIIKEMINEAIANGVNAISILIAEGVISNVTSGAVITGYAYHDFACGTDVWVPDTIDNMTVTGIGDYAFTTEGVDPTPNPVLNKEKEYNLMPLKNNLYNAKVMPIEQANFGIGITSIKLPNTIEFIGESAFRDSQISGILDLSSLTNLNSIGEMAFYYNKITSVILPSSVTTIGYSAFENYIYDESNYEWHNALTNVYLGNTNAEIGCQAFGRPSEIETHNLPNTYDVCVDE